MNAKNKGEIIHITECNINNISGGNEKEKEERGLGELLKNKNKRELNNNRRNYVEVDALANCWCYANTVSQFVITPIGVSCTR